MMDSNLIKSYLENVSSANQEPENKTEEIRESEPVFEEEEENEEEICDTRENSEFDNSFIDRRISNTSVLESMFSKVSQSSNLSEAKQYYSETIENLKNEYKDEFDYKNSKNYIAKEEYKKIIITEIKKTKENSQKNLNKRINNSFNKKINLNHNFNTQNNNIQFQRVNYPMNFFSAMRINGIDMKLVYINPIIFYRSVYFSNKCIPNCNIEKYQEISKDKKGDLRNFKEGSNFKEDEPKIEEPKNEEIKVEEYKTRSQRMKEKKKYYNRRYGNNYYNGNRNYQPNYNKNFKNYNRFNKSEY